MTQATDLAFSTRRAGDTRLIASVSTAHFVNHFYYLVLPPLFAFVRADYNVSYTELGLALAIFNVVSAVLQTPAGFLIDRIDARLSLVGGLILGALGYTIAALFDSYWVLIAGFALIGLGNTVYHPADYALLSHRVSPERVSQAYSIHTFSGMLGSAAAPVSMLFMHSLFGWRGAFFGASVLGVAVAAVLLMQRDTAAHVSTSKPVNSAKSGTALQLLLSKPIMMSLLFFTFLALGSFGVQNYSVVALGELYGTDPATANTALSTFLVFSAFGVLAGGWVAGRTTKHGAFAALGLGASGLATLLIGTVHLPTPLLFLAMAIAGFSFGAIMPARDMLVRAITPPGAFGRVFGFVTNGFSFGGIIAPLIYGALMDHGQPRTVFMLIGACAFLAIMTVVSTPKQRAA